MNTNKELEQIVRTWLEDRAVEPSRSGLTAALDRVAETPQQRHRWLGRWLGRGGGAMRSADDRGGPSGTGRNRLMYSLTTVAASLAALALAATLVVPRGDPGAGVVPGAPAGATHVVAADGTGDFSTIGEAVAAASDGDTVLVKPGEYAEALVIDKDITVAGEGDRDQIVISFPEGGPIWTAPDGIKDYLTVRLDNSDALLTGLSIMGAPPAGDVNSVAVQVHGGSPQLEDVSIAGSAGGWSIGFVEGSTGVLRGSSVRGDLFSFMGANPTFEGNTITASELTLAGPTDVTVRDNSFVDGASISARAGTTGLIERNVFTAGMTPTFGEAAINISGSGSKAHVVGNTVTGTELGISVMGGAEAIVEGNELVDDSIGIAWSSMVPGTIEGNVVSGGVSGIVVSGGSPSVLGNTVEGASVRGISVGSHATPSLSGNTVCGCGTNLYVSENATPQMGENEICADEGAE